MNIIFNGPPSSGKDEGCLFLEQEFGFKHLSFKDQLFLDTIEYFEVSSEWFFEGYNKRSQKEKPEDKLGGISRRDAMIFVSEEIKKKEHGPDYYGLQTAAKIDSNFSYCFSDGGFIEEVLPVINRLGTDNVCIAQLFREGCSFSSDSRNYLNGSLQEEFIINHRSKIEIEDKPFLPVRSYQIHNNGNVRDFHQTIRKILRKELDVKGKENDIP